MYTISPNNFPFEKLSCILESTKSSFEILEQYLLHIMFTSQQEASNNLVGETGDALGKGRKEKREILVIVL